MGASEEKKMFQADFRQVIQVNLWLMDVASWLRMYQHFEIGPFLWNKILGLRLFWEKLGGHFEWTFYSDILELSVEKIIGGQEFTFKRDYDNFWSKNKEKIFFDFW